MKTLEASDDLQVTISKIGDFLGFITITLLIPSCRRFPGRTRSVQHGTEAVEKPMTSSKGSKMSPKSLLLTMKRSDMRPLYQDVIYVIYPWSQFTRKLTVEGCLCSRLESFWGLGEFFRKVI